MGEHPKLQFLNVSLRTRRGVLRTLAGALCAGTVGGAFAQTSDSGMKQIPGSVINQTRTWLHEEIAIKAGPQRIYEALLSSKEFTGFSGLPAEIDPKVGGAFSMFGGQIVGRNVELTPNQRIVQAWRPTHWEAGVYSMVKFDLKPADSTTTVFLDHTGFPEGEFDHLEWGWHNHYWEPLKKFLA
jgi:activator of HSP90 ATPase